MADDQSCIANGLGLNPSLVPVDEAIAIIRAHAPEPRRTRLALDRADGRRLLSPVLATRDQPPFDASAMDGYAVTSRIGPDDGLKVTGESRAGHAFTAQLQPGQAVRVFTGAPLPGGTTRVILQEDVIREGARLRLKPNACPGPRPHIRPRGSDFQASTILLQAGVVLDAWKLGLAAAAGVSHVAVACRPTVALICTGDELAPAGTEPRPDQVYECNAIALSSLLRRWGAQVQRVSLQPDNRAQLLASLNAIRADIIVTVGGASVGDYDLVRPALEQAGIDWLFTRVDIKPGKPTAFGRLANGRRVLCLPGNPGAALICAHLFLHPLIASATGCGTGNGEVRLLALPCSTALPANGPRENWLRAIVQAGSDGAPALVPLTDQDSSGTSSFAVTGALLRRPAFAPPLMPGQMSPCILTEPI